MPAQARPLEETNLALINLIYMKNLLKNSNHLLGGIPSKFLQIIAQKAGLAPHP
jgi:hypothetical protein